jgi:hypothetical protein
MTVEPDDLSRLLDGELPPEQAARLCARIATDPALARRWAVLQALPTRIAALPREIPPPPPRAALAPAAAPPWPRRAAPWLGWLVAAGLAVALLQPEPVRVLASGTEFVDGRADLLAGDVRVSVDGIARVSVEPAGDGRRGVDAESDTMNTTHLLAAAAGSLVTVAVLEGSAWIQGDDAPRTEVRAGETRSVGGAPHAPKSRGAEPWGAQSEAKRPPAEERIADLERQLREARTENAMARGQLTRAQGTPSDWPADANPQMRPAAFERYVAEQVAAIPGAELVDVDCDEFPCVAVIRSHAPGEDWEDPLKQVHEGLGEAGFGANLGVVGLAADTQTPEGDLRLYAFGVAPGDAPANVHTRLKHRAEVRLEELMGEGGE